MNKYVLVGLLKAAGLTVLAVVVIGQYRDANRQLTVARDSYQVESVCNQYRATNSSNAYKACGNMQTEYNTEYLCNNTGTYCWTEVK